MSDSLMSILVFLAFIVSNYVTYKISYAGGREDERQMWRHARNKDL
jgi:hypothetical protein